MHEETSTDDDFGAIASIQSFRTAPLKPRREFRAIGLLLIVFACVLFKLMRGDFSKETAQLAAQEKLKQETKQREVEREKMFIEELKKPPKFPGQGDAMRALYGIKPEPQQKMRTMKSSDMELPKVKAEGEPSAEK